MRKSGILMPVFSLPSDYGIGTLGHEAYRFIDFLKRAGQSVWQLLPIGQTGLGDSPYQSFSSYAGNPYFIDLDLLAQWGYLDRLEYKDVDFGGKDGIDYGVLWQKRYSVLKLAYKRFITAPSEQYATFCAQNAWWLDDYALFCAIKDKHGGAPWNKWESPLKKRDPSRLEQVRKQLFDSVEFYKTLQYFFIVQWRNLKQYANQNGIEIMGDLPIYVAYDSADVWASPDQFELDENLNPIEVAGCPPDAFSADGQLWGNPLYNWEKMKNEWPKFNFWRSRISYSLKLYDIIRIDHFRGFESYYAIPFGDKTARQGRWRKGPDYELFSDIERDMGKLPIVAEDLGYLTDEVRNLLSLCGYPGMKVLQFAFDSREDSDYLPHNYTKNCVVYTGTHDNDTIVGWEKSAASDDVKEAKRYIRYSQKEGLALGMIKTAMASVADTAIIPMQDYLELSSVARINTPSTASGNWRWRMKKDAATDALAVLIYELTKTYRRLPK